jgi:hypothetical protein
VEEGISFHSSLILGFHGCDQSVAEGVISRKTAHLRASNNRYDWLGNGIYFWESSPARALEYALLSMQRPSPKQGKIRKPAVIGAVIDLGFCLDLLDPQFFDMVRVGYGMLKKSMALSNVPMPANRKLRGGTDEILRDLDCSVINTIHEYRRDNGLSSFDSVRAAFTEGDPLYEGAHFHDKNHIQICVRNVRCIKGYFHPVLG